MKPKMIVFDAGRTLLDYTEIDTRRGVSALMPFLSENPHGLTAGEIDRRTNEIFSHFEESRKQLFEVPERTVLTLVYDLLGLRFSIPLEEVERIIWREDARKLPTPHAGELLAALRKRGIRTAVISNLDFSGDLLRETLAEVFPDHSFEFVIASSDYGVRKPCRLLFEAGIARSGLSPLEIWYVGDKVHVDVAGSRTAGMTPVLYKFRRNTYGPLPEGLTFIDDLTELLQYI